MNLFVFTWDPNNGWNSGPDSYEELLDKLDKKMDCVTWWSGQAHRSYPNKSGRNDIQVGDKFILCRSKKEPKGIIGFGEIARTFYADVHYENPKKNMYRVDLKFNRLNKDIPFILSDDLKSIVGGDWNPLNHSHVNKAFSNVIAQKIWNELNT